MLTLALIMLILNADTVHGDVGVDLPGRGDGGGWGDNGRLRHPGGEKLHVLKLSPPKTWSRTKTSKCKKKPSQDGSTILLQPKLASGFITHPNRSSCSLVFTFLFWKLKCVQRDRLRGGWEESSGNPVILKLCSCAPIFSNDSINSGKTSYVVSI